MVPTGQAHVKPLGRSVQIAFGSQFAVPLAHSLTGPPPVLVLVPPPVPALLLALALLLPLALALLPLALALLPLALALLPLALALLLPLTPVLPPAPPIPVLLPPAPPIPVLPPPELALLLLPPPVPALLLLPPPPPPVPALLLLPPPELALLLSPVPELLVLPPPVPPVPPVPGAPEQATSVDAPTRQNNAPRSYVLIRIYLEAQGVAGKKNRWLGLGRFFVEMERGVNNGSRNRGAGPGNRLEVDRALCGAWSGRAPSTLRSRPTRGGSRAAQSYIGPHEAGDSPARNEP
jgi:hypothetical protein